MTMHHQTTKCEIYADTQFTEYLRKFYNAYNFLLDVFFYWKVR